MARDLTTSLSANLSADTVRPVLLFDAEFISGWVHLWSGEGDLEWNGNTYKGVGNFIGISAVEETNEVRAVGITITLAGLDLAITSIALQELAQNKAGRIWFGLLDATGAFYDGAPALLFSGLLDLGKIAESPVGATVTINYESRMASLDTPRLWLWDDQSQQAFFPGDLGFSYVGPLTDQVLQWGG